MTIPLREAPASRPPLLTLTVPLQPGPPAQDMLPFDEVLVAAAPPPGTGTEADERICRRLAIVVAEVLAGRRGLSQVQAVLHPDLGAQVGHLVRSGAARGLRVASVRVQVPEPGRAEATVRLADRQASRAVAVALTRAEASWQCVAIEAALTAVPCRPARARA